MTSSHKDMRDAFEKDNPIWDALQAVKNAMNPYNIIVQECLDSPCGRAHGFGNHCPVHGEKSREIERLEKIREELFGVYIERRNVFEKKWWEDCALLELTKPVQEE